MKCKVIEEKKINVLIKKQSSQTPSTSNNITYRPSIYHVRRYHDPSTNVPDLPDPSKSAAFRDRPSLVSRNVRHPVVKDHSNPQYQAVLRRQIACVTKNPLEDC